LHGRAAGTAAAVALDVAYGVAPRVPLLWPRGPAAAPTAACA
jgi:hypothetical protein